MRADKAIFYHNGSFMSQDSSTYVHFEFIKNLASPSGEFSHNLCHIYFEGGEDGMSSRVAVPVKVDKSGYLVLDFDHKFRVESKI